MTFEEQAPGATFGELLVRLGARLGVESALVVKFEPGHSLAWLGVNGKSSHWIT